MSRLFVPGGQSIGASASALPMKIQGWFPSGLTGLISLLSKRLSRVFSGTTIQKHQFFGTQPSLWSNSHIHTWLLKKPQFWLYRLWQWGHGFKILTENHISSRSLSRAKMSTKHEVQVKTFQNMEGLKNVLSRALMFSEIYHGMNSTQGFPGDSVVKNPLANAGDSWDLGLIPVWGRSPGGGKATHSSILA